MTCAICGKENQAGTRFCVHCGAALAAPRGGSQQSTIETAGAILAPKSARPVMPPPSATSTATIPPYVPPEVSSPPPASPPPPRAQETGFVSPPAEPAPPVPAYNADPKKAGWLVIAIAVAGLAIVGGYFAYRMVSSGGDVKDTLARMETPPPAVTKPPAQPAETPPFAVAEAPKPAPETPPPTPESKVPAVLETPPPVAAVPPKSEAKTPRPPSDKTSSRQAAPPPATTPPPIAAAPAPSPPRPSQASAAPTAAPVADRWTQFAEELHRCERETFLSRVVCDQRVRLRYCDGYWGKVAQCPGGVANPDRGQ